LNTETTELDYIEYTDYTLIPEQQDQPEVEQLETSQGMFKIEGNIFGKFSINLGIVHQQPDNEAASTETTAARCQEICSNRRATQRQGRFAIRCGKKKPPTSQKNKIRVKTKNKTKVNGKHPNLQPIKSKARGRKNRKMENAMGRAADDDTPTVENNCKCEDSPSSLDYGGMDYADEDGDCGEFKWSEVGHIPNV